jgi:catechol 2,3-dioxygenase
MTDFTIHPDTAIGAVHLTVADLTRSEQFYGEVLGFRALSRDGTRLTLAADGATPLLVLYEQPGARPKAQRATGLYHFAILVPNRLELARSLRRLAEMSYPLSGASDHLVSEALYLDDPDGNGIEIYRDRPRDEWPRINGAIKMAVDPLDVDGIINELAADDRPWEGLAPRTTIGHMHLHVADLRAAQAFYGGLLGLELMASMPSALFVAAGGYHHHLGLNTWAGVGAPPAPAGSAGLRHFVIRLPDNAARDQVLERVRSAGLPAEEVDEGWLVRDPSQNAVVLGV